MNKPKVLFVGGLSFNIPRPVLEHFEIVKHLEQGKNHRIGSIPRVDYVFILGEFVGHSLVNTLKEHARAAGIPVILFRRGWADLHRQLVKLGIWKEEKRPVGRAVAPIAKDAMAEMLVGLPQDELWERYGPSVIEAARALFTSTDCPSTVTFVYQVAEAVGLPMLDVEGLLQDLSMRGIIREEDGCCILTSADDSSFGTEPKKVVLPKRLRTGKTKEPLLDAVIKMAGLPHGPYSSKASLVQEMNKYTEFLTRWGKPFAQEANYKRIALGIELGVVKVQGTFVSIEHDISITLTRKDANHAP